MRPTSITRWGVLLGVVLAVALASGEALADRATEMKAREAFAAGRYEDALGLFAKLYAETLHPVYLRNIGRCHQKLRQPEKAIDKFNEYLAKEKKIAPDERAEIDGYIKEMEALRDEQARRRPPPAAAGGRCRLPPPPPATNPYPPPPSRHDVGQPGLAAAASGRCRTRPSTRSGGSGRALACWSRAASSPRSRCRAAGRRGRRVRPHIIECK